MEARRFPRGCIATPHHLASAVGVAVLSSGGNALDAAVAANLTLGVVTPYLCGFGGDLFALVWAEGRAHGYNGSGRAPAAATVEEVRVRAGGGRIPTFGPLAVTVPGAVRGWFDLLERFGSRPFAELARPACRLAEQGFPLSRAAAESIGRARDRWASSPWATGWLAVYGEAAPGRRLRQPGLARTLEALSAEGPDAYYRGPIAQAIAQWVGAMGGLLSAEDLARHHGDWVEPLSTTYRGLKVLELPPNTQGVTALEALNIAEALGRLPPDGPDRHHRLIEAVKLALADREAHVTDPAYMRMDPAQLVGKAWARRRAGLIDPLRALGLEAVTAHAGGTAYLCAADEAGMVVSLIQSNYMGFGSGVTVEEWGVNLHNRGASFSLDPDHVNAVAPGKRPLHTLIPALALRSGRPRLAFGTMGGDGQAQIHLQLLARVVDDGQDLQRAVDAPRWVVTPSDWSVTAEGRFDPAWFEDLRRRGHRVAATAPYDSLVGHAHALSVEDEGYAGATDPRAEGAVLGL